MGEIMLSKMTEGPEKEKKRSKAETVGGRCGQFRGRARRKDNQQRGLERSIP
jgi:hypothetical protein